MKLTIVLFTLTISGMPLAPLQAQSAREPGGSQVVASPAGTGQTAAAPRGQCQKLCQNDLSPCDPIYFKTEDGRCADVFMR